jgi:DNA repair exonuclease SbcCD nuclease subunit
MKKLLNIKNIALLLLIAIVVFQQCGGNKKGTGEIVKVDGKKYELLKHEIDTIEVVKTKVVTKKGEDIYHETIVEKEVRVPVNVDTNAILKEYYTKVLYKDVLVLPDSLGTVAVTDTISQNKILGRTFNANVKQRTIKETTIVKELPKTKVFYGLEGGFNKADFVSSVGAGVLINTKKDKIYQLGLGVTNQTTDGINGGFSPYIRGGVYWKIKLKK